VLRPGDGELSPTLSFWTPIFSHSKIILVFDKASCKGLALLSRQLLVETLWAKI
jgi:hypothetical protein